MEFGRIINYSINIEASANNGFFVTVGCCRLAYTDKKELISDLEAFLDDPERMEKEYNKVQGNVPQDCVAGTACNSEESPTSGRARR